MTEDKGLMPRREAVFVVKGSFRKQEVYSEKPDETGAERWFLEERKITTDRLCDRFNSVENFIKKQKGTVRDNREINEKLRKGYQKKMKNFAVLQQSQCAVSGMNSIFIHIN